MKQSQTALRTFFLALLCSITLQAPAAASFDEITTAVSDQILNPYEKTSTEVKWVVAIAAAITANRWYANQSAHSNCEHEIGRILYEISQLKHNKVKQTLLSAEQIEECRMQLEEELKTKEKLKTGANRRRWFWGLPAALLIWITIKNISGWRTARAERIEAEKKEEEKRETEAEEAEKKAAEEKSESDDSTGSRPPAVAPTSSPAIGIESVTSRPNCVHRTSGRCDACFGSH